MNTHKRTVFVSGGENAKRQQTIGPMRSYREIIVVALRASLGCANNVCVQRSRCVRKQGALKSAAVAIQSIRRAKKDLDELRVKERVGN